MSKLPTPLQLLKKYKKELERDWRKSCEMYRAGKIDYPTHMIHKKNLTPKIKKYQTAIKILQYYKK